MNDRGSMMYVFLLTLVAALGGLLFGYDTAVISGAIGFLEVKFDLDPQFMGGWVAACALVGCALGAALAGMLSDRFGRRGMLIVSALLFLISAIGTAFPATITQFIIFRIIGGLGIGAASMTSPMYIAEITPAKIRGRMVSINQFAIITGMLVVYFVNFFIAEHGKFENMHAIENHNHGTEWNVESAKKFIAERYLEKSPDREKLQAQIDALFAGDPNKLTAQRVADILTTEKTKVDPQYLYLKSNGLVSWNEDYGWRWMFASGIFPSGLFLILLFLVPESPRWLVAKNRSAEALAVLTRVGGSKHGAEEVAQIHAAISQETGSIRQLFQPGMRLVLAIGIVLAVLQQVTGINVFLYYAPEIFKKMGSETNVALLQQVIVGAVNLLFTVLACWVVDRLGRKPLMLVGATGMGVSLLAMGMAAYWQQTALWVLIFILGYIACFAMSVGPIVWVILSEIFPTSIRGRAMAIATVSLWVANYFVTQTFKMMDESPTLVNRFHHGFPFWIYAFFCAVTVVFVWLFVPETKGKTLEEIEHGWIK
jgi:SP family xylose:H+ symportor-like MFS transporter